jgi:hypothetical protein
MAFLKLANGLFQRLSSRADRRERLFGVAAKPDLVLDIGHSRRPRVPWDPRGVEERAESAQRRPERPRGLVAEHLDRTRKVRQHPSLWESLYRAALECQQIAIAEPDGRIGLPHGDGEVVEFPLERFDFPREPGAIARLRCGAVGKPAHLVADCAKDREPVVLGVVHLEA